MQRGGMADTCSVKLLGLKIWVVHDLQSSSDAVAPSYHRSSTVVAAVPRSRMTVVEVIAPHEHRSAAAVTTSWAIAATVVAP